MSSDDDDDEPLYLSWVPTHPKRNPAQQGFTIKKSDWLLDPSETTEFTYKGILRKNRAHLSESYASDLGDEFFYFSPVSVDVELKEGDLFSVTLMKKDPDSGYWDYVEKRS